MAFFPCVRFEDQIELYFVGKSFSQRNWTDTQKLEYAKRLERERADNYMLFSDLILIALRRNIKLIIENPWSGKHYLCRYFPIESAWIDHDRRDRGDSFKKPTQYWFINCEPKHNFVTEPIEYADEYRTVMNTHNTVERSMIKPAYARRFIQEFILD